MSFQKISAKNGRTLHQRVSDLAYCLWDARNRPFGSPEVDWLRAEMLVKDYLLRTPFDAFLRRATEILNSPTILRGVRDDVEYARIVEERRFVIDILDRVEMLAFAYSRLNSLSDLYRDAEDQKNATMRLTREEPPTYEMPEEIQWQPEYRALEARVLVAFMYYELTSLAHMLKDLKIQIPEGELRFLLKARDKFLAHPMFGSRVRNAHGCMTIPRTGLLHPHAINVAETDPILIDYYTKLFASPTALDETRLRDENERLILSNKKNSKFSAAERLRLKAFGIREPDLEASLVEMANLLLTSGLQEVERIGIQAIPSRR